MSTALVIDFVRVHFMFNSLFFQGYIICLVIDSCDRD